MGDPGLKVGLTGGFGTGKTTVAEIFRELGAGIVDADELARDSLQPGRKEYRQVIEEFGDRFLSAGGRIDRKALAGEVFSDPRLLKKLNQIIHPGVVRKIEEWMARSPKAIRVAVIPLLFEAGLADAFDRIVTVIAGPEIVQERTSAARGMSQEEIARRRAAQLPLAEKSRRADFVIDNNGTLAETRRQVEEIWEELGNREWGMVSGNR